MDGLLIDWGGVLTTSVLAAFDAFSVRQGWPEHALRSAFRDGPARTHLVELEEGTIELPEFERRLATTLDLAPEGLAQRLLADVRPDTEMRAAVRRYHDAGIRTALVSNSWNADDYDAELRAMFDAVILSQTLGTRKPARSIYECALDRLGLPAARCVFVDDLGGNLKPAKQLGMTTIKHERTADTIRALDEVLLPGRS
ncbi:HAD family phosphatase [Solirubrobacter phytolaccae]|uniref:HAD family phosphatase n=1 Tax=Solirubrobacter phytolaccae TaxID=1404360 RepID=A0A9X3N601_9ACTN|nr:HAD family phosphatase [Solirubrobacter phytolaccae]MDA0180269.1 HAD family phosphatase [Solirubrobacter phytolaccae]